MNELDKIKSLINESNKIVILSGAGVSTSSGIPDFRSNNGFYKNEEVEMFLSRFYYKCYPYSFWKSFKNIFGIKLLADEYEPNICHSIVNILRNKNKEVNVFTQNIDGLYKKITDVGIYEMHGNLEKFICRECNAEYGKNYILDNEVPYCTNIVGNEECGEILDTNVILFGDNINFYEDAELAIMKCDLLLVMGTSLSVFPVNELVNLKIGNCKKVIINREITPKDYLFDVALKGDLVNILNEIID